MLITNEKIYKHAQYQPHDNGNHHYYLFFHENYIANIVANSSDKSVLKLHVYELGSTNLFNLTYDELKNLKPALEEAAQKFKSKSVVICNHRSALVPDDVLNVVEADKYYELGQMILPQSQVLYCKMHFNGVTSLFNIKNDLVKLIRFNLPMVDVYHSSLLFCKSIANLNLVQPEKYLHINVHATFIEIAHYNGNLNFYNSFLVDAEADAVYYILATIEMLKLTNYEVRLYGFAEPVNSLNDLLKKYVQMVSLGTKPSGINLPEDLNNNREFEFFTELNALLCE